MTFEGTLAGLGLFSLEVLHLISIGKKEDIEVIEQHFGDNDLVEYLTEKYVGEWFVCFDNTSYDNRQLNKYFSEYDGYIQGQEDRKYGITNKDDGLLLILALVTDRVEVECRKWKA